MTIAASAEFPEDPFQKFIRQQMRIREQLLGPARAIAEMQKNLDAFARPMNDALQRMAAHQAQMQELTRTIRQVVRANREFQRVLNQRLNVPLLAYESEINKIASTLGRSVYQSLETYGIALEEEGRLRDDLDAELAELAASETEQATLEDAFYAVIDAVERAVGKIQISPEFARQLLFMIAAVLFPYALPDPSNTQREVEHEETMEAIEELKEAIPEVVDEKLPTVVFGFPTTHRVTRRRVIRESPDSSSKDLARLDPGATVTVHDRTGDWVFVTEVDEGEGRILAGWLHRHGLRPLDRGEIND